MKSLMSSYRRDPTPSLILEPSGHFVGWVWASGTFCGFRRWKQEEQIDHYKHMANSCMNLLSQVNALA